MFISCRRPFFYINDSFVKKVSFIIFYLTKRTIFFTEGKIYNYLLDFLYVNSLLYVTEILVTKLLGHREKDNSGINFYYQSGIQNNLRELIKCDGKFTSTLKSLYTNNTPPSLMRDKNTGRKFKPYLVSLCIRCYY